MKRTQMKLCANLSVSWTTGADQHASELLAVVSDRRACPPRLREYGVRMDTEQSFREYKTGGFDMADTRLQHADRLERMLLALAIAKLWCHENKSLQTEKMPVKPLTQVSRPVS